MLEPLGAAGNAALRRPAAARDGRRAARAEPRMDACRTCAAARITVGIYLSEAEAQRIAQAIRQGRGGSALAAGADRGLQGDGAFRRRQRRGGIAIAREDGEDFEDLAAAPAACCRRP